MFTGIVEERGVVLEAGTSRLVVGCRTVVIDSDDRCLDRGERRVPDRGRERRRRPLVRPLAGDARPLDPGPARARRSGEPRAAGDALARGSAGTSCRGTWMASARSPASDRDDAGGAVLTVRVPDGLLRYVVEKGSITVDGVSLTVAAIAGDGFAGRADPAHARRRPPWERSSPATS